MLCYFFLFPTWTSSSSRTTVAAFGIWRSWVDGLMDTALGCWGTKSVDPNSYRNNFNSTIRHINRDIHGWYTMIIEFYTKKHSDIWYIYIYGYTIIPWLLNFIKQQKPISRVIELRIKSWYSTKWRRVCQIAPLHHWPRRYRQRLRPDGEAASPGKNRRWVKVVKSRWR